MTTVDPADPSSSIPTVGLAFDPDQIIEQDLPCRNCGYNLRSQSMGGRCPECNTSVESSTRSDLMRFADPRWLQKLFRGAIITAITIIAPILWGFAQVAIRAITNPSFLTRYGIYGVSIVITLVDCLGWWLLTQPDPSGLERIAIWQLPASRKNQSCSAADSTTHIGVLFCAQMDGHNGSASIC